MKNYLNYIKEMHLFNVANDCEKLFLELSHFDDLKIEFNFIDYESISYNYYINDIILFEYNKPDGTFVVNYSEIWHEIHDKYDLNGMDMQIFMNNMIMKYFNVDEDVHIEEF